MVWVVIWGLVLNLRLLLGDLGGSIACSQSSIVELVGLE